jgi:YidC/Oxa1 family membrane protein insertase
MMKRNRYHFTKQFKAIVPLAFKNGEISEKMNWYYGPTDYKLLKSYDRNIEDIVALGWVFLVGSIDMHSYLYFFLSMFIQHGWAIILFTILVKLVLSPIL